MGGPGSASLAPRATTALVTAVTLTWRPVLLPALRGQTSSPLAQAAFGTAPVRLAMEFPRAQKAVSPAALVATREKRRMTRVPDVRQGPGVSVSVRPQRLRDAPTAQWDGCHPRLVEPMNVTPARSDDLVQYLVLIVSRQDARGALAALLRWKDQTSLVTAFAMLAFTIAQISRALKTAACDVVLGSRALVATTTVGSTYPQWQSPGSGSWIHPGTLLFAVRRSAVVAAAAACVWARTSVQKATRDLSARYAGQGLPKPSIGRLAWTAPRCPSCQLSRSCYWLLWRACVLPLCFPVEPHALKAALFLWLSATCCGGP
mmetsp:Transcript_39858/g.104394  ORF Transcript_39858/g.104394 Transcript_39858/m.104394 type:complete len:317 (-) Transcript_39858:8047-8997(-)